MRTLITIFFLTIMALTTKAKPHCQSFNNYDDKVTIVLSDDNAGDRYSVSDVKLIPSWKGEEYKASSIRTNVKDGVATVTLIFPHITHFSNPMVTLRINGKKYKIKVCQ